MKVTLTCFYGEASPGDVVDLKKAEAERLIGQKAAMAFVEPPRPVAPAPAPEPAPAPAPDPAVQV